MVKKATPNLGVPPLQPGSAPFRKEEPTEELVASAFYNKHDLREMYTRENTERRRMGGHTLRKHFTAAQDRTFIAKALKVREEYQVANNDDVAIVLVQQWIADGKEAEIDPRLLAIAKRTVIPKRTPGSAVH